MPDMQKKAINQILCSLSRSPPPSLAPSATSAALTPITHSGAGVGGVRAEGDCFAWGRGGRGGAQIGRASCRGGV